MIIPMQQYTMALYHQDLKATLQKLRELGVVHINENKEVESEALIQDIQYADQISSALKFLSKRAGDTVRNQKWDGLSGKEIMETYLERQAALDSLKQKKQQVEKEIAFVASWGDFSGDTIQKLKANGLYLYFYIVPLKRMNPQWSELYHLVEIEKSGTDVYFVLVTRDENDPEIQAEPIEEPQRSAGEFQQELNRIENEIQQVDHTLDQLVHCMPVLRKTLDELNDRIVFARKEHSVNWEVDDKVVLLSAWVPREKNTDLEKFLEEHTIYFIKHKEVGDVKEIPVALKNNRFASLFEDVGKLFSLPQYKELDMTPFFAPFFAMFFGFCLGDAGYGLFFILLATFLKYKMPKWKPIFSLVQVFGLTTIFFGIISGTFWGVRLLDVDILESYHGIILSDEQLFNLALMIGVFQILFGMVLKVVNRYIQLGWKYSLSTVGWLILLIWLLVRYFVIDQPDSYLILHRVLLSVSLFLIFFFANPAVNFFMNIGLGLWDVYLMITGLLGDVLSYIRLFALGISSAILGLVFNEIALTTLSTPVLGPVFFLIIFVFGHGINLFMASLGAFIHPMRLTFVEFYKNAGFSGGGRQYIPFKKVSNNSL